MKKTVLGLVAFVLLPLAGLIVIGGVMQGGWFDTENLMELPDMEVYEIPCWQYCVYYATSFLLLVSECLVFSQFIRLSASKRYLYWGLFVIIIVLLVLLALIPLLT